MPNYPERRAAVYRVMVEQANQSQAGIRESLNSLGIRHRAYYLVNAIEVEGGPLVRFWLSTRPDVDRILESPRLRPLTEYPTPEQGTDLKAPDSAQWNLTMIHASQVWAELNIMGEGIVIGQSDSGVDGQHPEFAGQYRGFNAGGDFNWYDPWFQSAAPVDLDGHGTHTLGTILGKNVGVAPHATWIGCVNLALNLGNPAVYLDCMQFMLAPFPQQGDAFKDGRPELGANILNNSWGCPIVEGCDAGTYLAAVRALQTAGVFVVASAGNEGENGCSTVADPLALYDEVYTVGALDSERNRASFSNLGPVTVDGSSRIKPDLMAPGAGILSSFPGGTYASLSGTSMAGPHVVGTVALMWSANPKLIGDIKHTREILNLTAQSYSGKNKACGGSGVPSNTSGYGIVDAYNAVKMALEER
jgi:subtilisin family serine protease